MLGDNGPVSTGQRKNLPNFGTVLRGQDRMALALARVEFYHLTVFGLNSCQRVNEVTMSDYSCGVDTFALEKLSKPVRSILQGLMRFN